MAKTSRPGLQKKDSMPVDKKDIIVEVIGSKLPDSVKEANVSCIEDGTTRIIGKVVFSTDESLISKVLGRYGLKPTKIIAEVIQEWRKAK